MKPSEMIDDQLCKMFGCVLDGRPMDTKETAAFLGISTDTLEGYRYRGVGPRYFMPKGTRRVWYSKRDLLEWLASGLRHSTSDQPDTWADA